MSRLGSGDPIGPPPKPGRIISLGWEIEFDEIQNAGGTSFRVERFDANVYQVYETQFGVEVKERSPRNLTHLYPWHRIRRFTREYRYE